MVDGKIEVISKANFKVLYIPANAQASEWSHQVKGWFSKGDTRTIGSAELIINGKPVDQLLETYDSE